eukprot:457782_1
MKLLVGIMILYYLCTLAEGECYANYKLFSNNGICEDAQFVISEASVGNTGCAVGVSSGCSYRIVCGTDEITLTIFTESNTCTGASTSSSLGIDTCASMQVCAVPTIAKFGKIIQGQFDKLCGSGSCGSSNMSNHEAKPSKVYHDFEEYILEKNQNDIVL